MELQLISVNHSRTMIQFHDFDLNLITTPTATLTLERSGKPKEHEYQVMFGGKWRCNVSEQTFVEINKAFGFPTPAYGTAKEKD
jgi:hypothetical protein